MSIESMPSSSMLDLTDLARCNQRPTRLVMTKLSQDQDNNIYPDRHGHFTQFIPPALPREDPWLMTMTLFLQKGFSSNSIIRP
jgi:hypothetical protein